MRRFNDELFLWEYFVGEYIEFFGNHPILSAVWFGLLIALVFSHVQGQLAKFTRVNSSQLTQMVNQQNAILVDIRAVDEFQKGHIAGAKNLTLEQVEAENLKGLEKAKDKPIIVICAAGMSATKAANKLVALDYQQVSILEGGMNSWAGANLPVAKG